MKPFSKFRVADPVTVKFSIFFFFFVSSSESIADVKQVKSSARLRLYGRSNSIGYHLSLSCMRNLNKMNDLTGGTRTCAQSSSHCKQTKMAENKKPGKYVLLLVYLI